MPPSPPILELNYDISCPFAYIASTRVRDLAARTGATLLYRPVLLGAIYRATAAPQGAAGSASDVFNAAKKDVTRTSMSRTLRRYKIAYDPPPEHPRKSVNALRLLYAVDGDERARLTDALFAAYWAQRRDVTDVRELLKVAEECNISGLSLDSFNDTTARGHLEKETQAAIDRGAFGVPGFWIPAARWVDRDGKAHEGRFFWGQDRMHFVEATLLALQRGSDTPWSAVSGLHTLIPRAVHTNTLPAPTRLEFWFDFSSPWAYLGYTQLGRLQALFGPQLEIQLKPFLLGILFREIGAPMLPMAAVSVAKRTWVQQDHADWVRWWNSVAESTGTEEGKLGFTWASVFPIRTPTVLRVGIVEPKAVPALCMFSVSLPIVHEGISSNTHPTDAAAWSHNADISTESTLISVLTSAGFNGADLVARANEPGPKAKLRDFTAQAKALGICGVPTYRVLRQDKSGEWNCVGGLVWGQDEVGVLEDLIAGWDGGEVREVAGVKAEGKARL